MFAICSNTVNAGTTKYSLGNSRPCFKRVLLGKHFLFKSCESIVTHLSIAENNLRDLLPNPPYLPSYIAAIHSYLGADALLMFNNIVLLDFLCFNLYLIIRVIIVNVIVSSIFYK